MFVHSARIYDAIYHRKDYAKEPARLFEPVDWWPNLMRKASCDAGCM